MTTPRAAYPACRACSFGHPSDCESPTHCRKEPIVLTRYRKRPVVIDAFQFTGDHAAVDRWLDLLGYGEADGPSIWADGDALVIGTLEGNMTASVGDWLIRGVQGEFYPCKPDIFEATYEPAKGDTAAGGAS